MTITADKCYNTYAAAVGGVSFTGETLPKYEDTPETVQGGWEAVATEFNKHETLSNQAVRGYCQKTIDSCNVQIRRLQNANEALLMEKEALSLANEELKELYDATVEDNS